MSPLSGQRPTASSAIRRDLGLGHSRIVLELERRQLSRLVAAKPAEADDGADVGAPAGQPRDLGAGVEVLGLDAHDRADMRRQF